MAAVSGSAKACRCCEKRRWMQPTGMTPCAMAAWWMPCWLLAIERGYEKENPMVVVVDSVSCVFVFVVGDRMPTSRRHPKKHLRLLLHCCCHHLLRPWQPHRCWYLLPGSPRLLHCHYQNPRRPLPLAVVALASLPLLVVAAACDTEWRG